MDPSEGFPAGRRERLEALLAQRSLAAVWFAQPSAFAWLVGGDNVVDRTETIGVAAAGYDGETVRVVTSDIEAARLREEELPEEVHVESYEWHAESLADAVAVRSPTPAAADFDVPGMKSADASALRQPLTARDIEQYRDLGATVAKAVETVCRGASPTATERTLAARLRERLAVAGIETPVTLVGGERRAGAYRHYTPTDAKLGGYALVSVTAERKGLFASCTRTVAFDPPEWLSARHRSAARVEATALAATRAVGRRDGTASEVFDAIRGAYAAEGWPEEWRHHHQGGAAGYAGREWIATPDADDSVQLPMAYAWNPTVQGAKSEDTVVVEASGYEPLTTNDWPTMTVEAVDFEEEFERPAVLSM